MSAFELRCRSWSASERTFVHFTHSHISQSLSVSVSVTVLRCAAVLCCAKVTSIKPASQHSDCEED